MRISLIVAMDRKGVIGAEGELPWHLAADLRNFKAITMGKPIVMGRKTHESIGRPLPGRQNIVLTRSRHYRSPGCIVVNDIDQIDEICSDAEEIMITGGADLFRQTLARADRLYLTEVDADVTGDVYFPAFTRDEWQTVEVRDFPRDENNQYAFRFSILERKRGKSDN